MIANFDKLAKVVQRESGIVLDSEKQYLVEARLLSAARAHGFENATPLINCLIEGGSPDMLASAIDALTTNETYFFRDRTPFELFGSVMLPYFLRERAERRAIRIWCSACSTGQEPYSLAMTVDQFSQPLAGWRISLHATDLSRTAINAARAGLYNQFEAQRGMAMDSLLRYFNKEGENWRIADHLRARVRYSCFNLLEDFTARGEFDVIFCRNVLIYFDQATRRDVLARLAKALRPDGFLILGSTETVGNMDPEWISLPGHQMLYVRSDGPHAHGLPHSH